MSCIFDENKIEQVKSLKEKKASKKKGGALPLNLYKYINIQNKKKEVTHPENC